MDCFFACDVAAIDLVLEMLLREIHVAWSPLISFIEKVEFMLHWHKWQAILYIQMPSCRNNIWIGDVVETEDQAGLS